MIVERRIHKAKWGCMGELVALTRAVCDSWGLAYRVCHPIVGPGHTVVFEMSFESEAKREEFWKAFYAKPETAAFLAKFGTLAENELTIELLSVL